MLAVKKIKHKAYINDTYLTGLRVSEVVNLKITDIDSDRRQLKIIGAKGKKDRVATLSKYNLQVLRNYGKIYKPKEFLFEGQYDDSYATRSTQIIFKAFCEEINYPKPLAFIAR